MVTVIIVTEVFSTWVILPVMYPSLFSEKKVATDLPQAQKQEAQMFRECILQYRFS